MSSVGMPSLDALRPLFPITNVPPIEDKVANLEAEAYHQEGDVPEIRRASYRKMVNREISVIRSLIQQMAGSRVNELNVALDYVTQKFYHSMSGYLQRGREYYEKQGEAVAYNRETEAILGRLHLDDRMDRLRQGYDFGGMEASRVRIAQCMLTITGDSPFGAIPSCVDHHVEGVSPLVAGELRAFAGSSAATQKALEILGSVASEVWNKVANRGAENDILPAGIDPMPYRQGLRFDDYD